MNANGTERVMDNDEYKLFENFLGNEVEIDFVTFERNNIDAIK